MRKIFPFIPIVGIFLTTHYHLEYGDTGLEKPTIAFITAFIQGFSIIGLIIFICLLLGS